MNCPTCVATTGLVIVTAIVAWTVARSGMPEPLTVAEVQALVEASQAPQAGLMKDLLENSQVSEEARDSMIRALLDQNKAAATAHEDTIRELVGQCLAANASPSTGTGSSAPTGVQAPPYNPLLPERPFLVALEPLQSVEFLPLVFEPVDQPGLINQPIVGEVRFPIAFGGFIERGGTNLQHVVTPHDPNPIPLPGAIGLFAIAVTLGMIMLRRRRH